MFTFSSITVIQFLCFVSCKKFKLIEILQMGILKFNQYFILGLYSYFLLDIWSALSV